MNISYDYITEYLNETLPESTGQLKEMEEYAKKYQGYGFEKNSGYGTKQHIERIKEIGPCQIHRKTFIKNFWDI